MPSKTEKQKRFFGAVEGAKHGQKGVSGKAKKVAKEISDKDAKDMLKVKKDEDEEGVPLKKKMHKNDSRNLGTVPLRTSRTVINIPNPTVPMKPEKKPLTRIQQMDADMRKAKDSDEETMSKKKGKKKMVKENSAIHNFIECLLLKKYASANKYLNNAVELKIQNQIEAELETPLFQ